MRGSNFHAHCLEWSKSQDLHAFVSTIPQGKYHYLLKPYFMCEIRKVTASLGIKTCGSDLPFLAIILVTVQDYAN